MCCDNCEGKCKNEQRISDLEIQLMALLETIPDAVFAILKKIETSSDEKCSTGDTNE